MIKLKWKVGDRPTGQYRSFFNRPWPSATFEGKTAISLECEDSYEPSSVKVGKHKEITIKVAKWRKTQSGEETFDWKIIKRRARNLQ